MKTKLARLLVIVSMSVFAISATLPPSPIFAEKAPVSSNCCLKKQGWRCVKWGRWVKISSSGNVASSSASLARYVCR